MSKSQRNVGRSLACPLTEAEATAQETAGVKLALAEPTRGQAAPSPGLAEGPTKHHIFPILGSVLLDSGRGRVHMSARNGFPEGGPLPQVGQSRGPAGASRRPPPGAPRSGLAPLLLSEC